MVIKSILTMYIHILSSTTCLSFDLCIIVNNKCISVSPQDTGKDRAELWSQSDVAW